MKVQQRGCTDWSRDGLNAQSDDPQAPLLCHVWGRGLRGAALVLAVGTASTCPGLPEGWGWGGSGCEGPGLRGTAA